MEYASCYFCATAVEAPIREYPVVPDDVDPDVDVGATIALCSTCRRKLDTILDPVVAELESLHLETASGAGDDLEDAGGEGDADSTGGRDAADDDDADGTDDPLSALTVPGPEDVDAGESTDENGSRTDDEDDSGASRDQDPDDDADRIDTEDIPVDAYNKIVRLLKNREFPVARAEIAEVASSAYDLPRNDCERAIDAMLDRGVLVEDGSRLVKGDPG